MLGEIGTFCSVLFLGLVSTRSLIPQRFSPPRTAVVSAVEEEEDDKKESCPSMSLSQLCPHGHYVYFFPL